MVTTTERRKDCLSCRIISSMSLTCAGLFVGYHGCRHKGYSRVGMLAIAIFTTGLGVARIFDPQGRLYGSFRTS